MSNKVHVNGTEPMEHRMVIPWDTVGIATFSQFDDDGVLLYKGFQFETPTGAIVFPIRVLPVSPEAESTFDKAKKVFIEALQAFQRSQTT